MQMRRWCRSSKRTARPPSLSLTCGFTVPAWMGPSIVLYEYQPGRSGEYPKKFLEGFRGYLHTDGYAGYNQVRILPAAAAGHLRRKFVEAMPAASSNPKGLLTPARLVLLDCLQLKRNCELPKKDRNSALRWRNPCSGLFGAGWKSWNGSLAGNLKKAVQYARKQQPYMENYLLDPRCQISNNLAENAIRPFTVGRKNWLFSDTVKGAKASAVIYSLVETAGANGLSERGYLPVQPSLHGLPPASGAAQGSDALERLLRSCFEQE